MNFNVSVMCFDGAYNDKVIGMCDNNSNNNNNNNKL